MVRARRRCDGFTRSSRWRPAIAPDSRHEGCAQSAMWKSALTLTLYPGERVAVVGPSGAGKSTVAALLLGFAAPTAGRITVGGRDLVAVDSAAWRAGVGWLPQRPSLFLVDPALLILDEPTANLDVESEAAVRAALERLAPGRTVLVIAHSPAIAATADRVVVLDHGRVDQAAPPAPAAAGGCASREAPAEPGARRDATAPRPASGVRELVPGARGLVPARHPGGTR